YRWTRRCAGRHVPAGPRSLPFFYRGTEDVQVTNPGRKGAMSDPQETPGGRPSNGGLTHYENDAESERTRRDSDSVLVLGLAVLALLVSIVGVGFGARAISQSEGGSGGGGEGGGGGGSEVFEVELGELYVKPAKIEVEAGTEVVVNVTNAGEM